MGSKQVAGLVVIGNKMKDGRTVGIEGETSQTKWDEIKSYAAKRGITIQNIKKAAPAKKKRARAR